METVRFSEVSIFVVTLEVAIAVVSLFSLTIVFGLFALLAFEQSLYMEEEAEPVLIASAIFSISIYVLQIFQLLTGIFLLKSLTLLRINIRGAVKTSWIWLIASALSASVLIYLIGFSATNYVNYPFLLTPLVALLAMKVLSVGFVLRFTIGACAVVVKPK